LDIPFSARHILLLTWSPSCQLYFISLNVAHSLGHPMHSRTAIHRFRSERVGLLALSGSALHDSHVHGPSSAPDAEHCPMTAENPSHVEALFQSGLLHSLRSALSFFLQPRYTFLKVGFPAALDRPFCVELYGVLFSLTLPAQSPRPDFVIRWFPRAGFFSCGFVVISRPFSSVPTSPRPADPFLTRLSSNGGVF